MKKFINANIYVTKMQRKSSSKKALSRKSARTCPWLKKKST